MVDSDKKSGGPHPVDIHVGSRVRLRRMILGLSQDKLGDALGLTFQQIQKYEKGVNRIGASRMFQISQVLNVPVQYFFDDFTTTDTAGVEGVGESEAGDTFMSLVNSPEGVQLCRYFARIEDPRVRRRVLELVKTLSEEDEDAVASASA